MITCEIQWLRLMIVMSSHYNLISIGTMENIFHQMQIEVLETFILFTVFLFTVEEYMVVTIMLSFGLHYWTSGTNSMMSGLQKKILKRRLKSSMGVRKSCLN
uniref:Uncharacterized protein n=2 Tax=Arundo donax TaxID=35708 RepID=A0A0A9DJ82_ARUDO